MPLTAIAYGRRVVSVLLTDDEWEQVKDLARREPDSVLYPGSDRQVFCRTSTRGLRHFVSRDGQGETAPESAHQLMMKAHVARALAKAGWSEVDVEVPFPAVDRIADVAATNPAGRRVVFEVQLSRQTRADFRTRTEDYASCGATTIWITPYVGRVPAGVSAIWTSVRVSDPSPTERTIASSSARLYRDGDLSSPKDRFDTLLNKVFQGQTWHAEPGDGLARRACARSGEQPSGRVLVGLEIWYQGQRHAPRLSLRGVALPGDTVRTGDVENAARRSIPGREEMGTKTRSANSTYVGFPNLSAKRLWPPDQQSGGQIDLPVTA